MFTYSSFFKRTSTNEENVSAVYSYRVGYPPLLINRGKQSVKFYTKENIFGFRKKKDIK